VRDRFGDHGLVGVAIARFRARDAELDTFLLSCRVLSRGVETAFLAALCEQLKANGVTRLSACFIPTPKNAPARAFLAEHGLSPVAETADRSNYELDLAKAPAWPAWISRTEGALGPEG
jgi:FkbH-like protein